MKTSSPPAPAVSLAPQLYFQVVHTLMDLLPPPLDDSPDALRARNLAAVAKVAALLPVNADETDLAAQCVAARGQAEDIMRLIRENRHDIPLTMRLNAQYASMVRTSLSARANLMRVQAARQKREAIEGAADQDAGRQQAIEQCMLIVAEPEIERITAASSPAARENAPPAAPTEAPEPGPSEGPFPRPHASQESAEIVSEDYTNSHDMAFETWMSKYLEDQGPDETGLRRRVLEALAEAHRAV
jgi:hypothetical protein